MRRGDLDIGGLVRRGGLSCEEGPRSGLKGFAGGLCVSLPRRVVRSWSLACESKSLGERPVTDPPEVAAHAYMVTLPGGRHSQKNRSLRKMAIEMLKLSDEEPWRLKVFVFLPLTKKLEQTDG